MKSENDLIQKLMISKKIMEKHDTIKRNQTGGMDYDNTPVSPTTPMVQSFTPPVSSYNLPQEVLQESQMQSVQSNKIPQVATKDRILSSKLPDEIKRLMIEHPIQQPDSLKGPSISDELFEKAARLMNVNAKGEQVGPPIQKKQSINENTNVDPSFLKKMIKETVREVLSENGLLVESTNKANETFSFRVGEHIFEGKLTKIKKISK